MAQQVILQRMGDTVDSVVVLEWLVSVGDTVAVGDALVRVETDKVEVDVESPFAGTVSALAVAGQTGTLDQYFVGTSIENRLVAKTGSLSDVKGLIGYLPAEGGSLIRFVVLLEATGVDEPSAFVPIWEELLGEAIGSYPSGPIADQLLPLAVVPR